MSNLNYAERAVLLERIVTLEQELLIERALIAELEHVRNRLGAALGVPEELSRKQGRVFEIDENLCLRVRVR